MTIRSAVITGGTSMLALALERELVDNGAAVTLLVRPASVRLEQMEVSSGTRIIEHDLANLNLLCADQMSSCDAFYHFGWAGTFGPARNDTTLQCRNIGYTLDAVELAARLGCSVFVGAGSQAEYGYTDSVLTSSTPANPVTAYGIAKLAAGQLARVACRQYGIRHIWARVLSIYGPGDRTHYMMSGFIRSLVRGERMSLTAGKQRCDYLYCGDAARAFYLMGLHGRDGMIYPLASGQPRSLREYVLAARDAVNPAAGVGLGELPYSSGQAMRMEADISELRRDTGFEPAVSFEEGARLTADWLNSFKH